ncbi:hypothetical protein CSUI_011395, partial [Cystoisospora suis]
FCFLLCSFIVQLELQRRCLQLARGLCKETSELRFRHLQRDYIELTSRLQDLPSALLAFHRIDDLLSPPEKRETAQAKYGNALEREIMLASGRSSRRSSLLGHIFLDKGDVKRKDNEKSGEEEEFQGEDCMHAMEDLIAAEQKKNFFNRFKL